MSQQEQIEEYPCPVLSVKNASPEAIALAKEALKKLLKEVKKHSSEAVFIKGESFLKTAKAANSVIETHKVNDMVVILLRELHNELVRQDKEKKGEKITLCEDCEEFTITELTFFGKLSGSGESCLDIPLASDVAPGRCFRPKEES